MRKIIVGAMVSLDGVMQALVPVLLRRFQREHFPSRSHARLAAG